MEIVTILERNYPGAQWVLAGNDYDGLDWLDESPKPSKKELEDAWPAVQFAVELERVERARSAAYRETADPLFFQYKRGEITEQEWLDAVQAVKDAHPYPVA